MKRAVAGVEAMASLVKRSVIKISRQGGREREKRRSIDADSGPSVFFPPSIDVFSQLQLEREDEEEERWGCSTMCVRRWAHILNVYTHMCVSICVYMCE